MLSRSATIAAVLCIVGSADAFLAPSVLPHTPSARAASRSPLWACKAAEGGDAEHKPAGATHSRRAALSLSAAAALGSVITPREAGAVKAGPKLDEAWWQEKLKSGKISKKAYLVLHEQDTERPNTSNLLNEKRDGVFVCAACDTPVFEAKTKFNSGTGWPSFYDKLEGVELETDNYFDKMVALREECHCVKCGGHLGHVFGDGLVWNVPTGKRYCINGLALSFVPAASESKA